VDKQRFYTKPWHIPKMLLIAGADEHPETQMERGCCDSEVVGWNQTTGAAQGREEFGPALGDLEIEGDDRNCRDERIDFRAPTHRAGLTLGEPSPDEEL
jgi:hypothetical protein